MKHKSISISGLLTLDLHALNNEGAEGNTMMTRMVDIVDGSGKKHTVNAISGDMFKHIQTGHLIGESLEMGLPLCEGCRRFDANRICGDDSFVKDPAFNKETLDSSILSAALKKCVVDDMQGILITSEIGKKRSIARKSCVEFGWAVGRPGAVSTESYFHAKYVPEGRGKGSESSDNLGQNIFHRPASSGQYAVVVGVDLFRVLRNDISLEVTGTEKEVRNRQAALIRSVMNTFVKPTGAHRNTQNPHIVDFQGVITSSSSSLPAPNVSALNSEYVAEAKRIAQVLNQIHLDAIDVHEFNSLSAFVEAIAMILGPEIARAHA
ncbi:MAG TPA: DevR family CRISPR-associated autoregulator [Candidatus Angelobacter sp.]|nr:DevR family CRISPR-associated autoregulator [Candidatus Angelobacter sp.]